MDTDREAITDCLYRYTRGIDRLDRDLVRSAYHDDAVDDVPPQQFRREAKRIGVVILDIIRPGNFLPPFVARLGRQQRREEHERHGDAVHAHVVADPLGDPIRAFLELEAGVLDVEVDPQRQRSNEDDEARPERDIARIARDNRFVPARQQDEQRADQRQECDDGEPGEIGHGLFPTTRNQVISAATPRSMANA